MEPVKFEIIGLDKSKPATDSAAKNVDDLTNKINQQKAVIEGLQAEITKLQATGSKGAGVRTQEDQAMINALEKQVKELQASLVDLQNQKEKTSTTPILPPSINNDVMTAKKSFNGLNMSIQQVARELPSLAMGPQMFFLAISNNLPILSDQIKVAKQEYDALLATGVKGTPVWRQVLSSLFSWQTALTASITLLIVFAPKLADLFSKLGKGKEVIDANTIAWRNYTDAQNKAIVSAQKELVHLSLLYKATQNDTLSRNERNKAADELQKLYPKFFANMTNEEILVGKAATQYKILAIAILDAAKARAYEEKIVENEKEKLKIDQQRIGALVEQVKAQRELEKSQSTLNKLGQSGGTPEEFKFFTKQIRDQRIEVDKYGEEAAMASLKIEALNKSNDNLAKSIKPSDLLFGKKTPKTKAIADITNYSDVISDAEAKAAKKVEEMKLALMRDGYDKRKEEARIQLQAELSRIAIEERERLQAVARARKKGIAVSPAQVSTITSTANLQRSMAQDIYTASLSKLYDESIDAMVGKYQDYTDKRIAIERQYNEDVRKLIQLRQEAEAEGDQISIDRLNRAINQATVDRAKNLMRVSMEQFKESPEYIRAFEDLRNTSTDTLNYLLAQFEKYKNEAAKTFDPKDLREYTTTMRELMDEIAARDPFAAVVQYRKDLANAEREMNIAQANLSVVQAGGQAIGGYKLGADGKIQIQYLNEEQAIKRVIKSKDKYYEVNKKLVDSESNIVEIITQFNDSADKLGQRIGGVAGDTISFIAGMSNFAMTLTSVTKVAVTSITAMEKASVILTVISTVMQLMQQFDSMVKDSYQEYEAYDKKIEEINKMVDAVNQYELAVLKAQQAEKGWFGSDSLRDLTLFKQQQQQIMQSYFDKLNEMQATYQNKSGDGWLTSPWKKAWNVTYGNIYGKIGDYNESLTRAQENLRIETRSAKKGFLGTGIGGRSQRTEDLSTWVQTNLGLQLFDTSGMIDENVAKAVLDQYGDKLVGQTKQTLEELVSLKEQYNEYIKQLREYVASAYSPLVDNMTQALFDWLDTGKNAMDSFKDYASDTFRDIARDMIETLVMDKVFKGFQDDISKMYDEYFSGKTNETQLSASIAERMNALLSTFKEQMPGLETILKTISDSFKNAGIDITGNNNISQNAQVGGITTITEDTGTRIEGALTGMTNRVISIDDRVERIRLQWDNASKILADIAYNTLTAANLLQDIKVTLNTINRDGIQMK